MTQHLLVPSKPGSVEDYSYNRRPTLFYFIRRPITWLWKISDNWVPATGIWPALQMKVKRARPNAQWEQIGAPVACVGGTWNFVFDLPDGNYLISFDGAPVRVLEKAFYIRTGQPLTDEDTKYLWSTTNRFEIEFEQCALGHALIEYPGARPVPKVYPKKPRVIEKTTVRLKHSEMWVRRFQAHQSAGMTRRFVKLPDGTPALEEDQKYFYSDVRNAESGPPRLTIQDGTFGVGSLGMVYKVIISPANVGIYHMDPMGRLAFTAFEDGRTSTLAGWRVRVDGLKVHGAVMESGYDSLILRQYPTAEQSLAYKKIASDRKAYFDSHEVVGDWSRVPGLKRFREPWGFDALDNGPTDGFHEFWIADTIGDGNGTEHLPQSPLVLNKGRLLYVNHYTAHPHDHYEKPKRPPPGYVAPEAPTGKSEVVVLASDLLQPWDCKLDPDTQTWLYFSEFGGNRIRRINTITGVIEMVVDSFIKPTDAELGIPRRLFNSEKTYTEIKGKYVIDGPLGQASCVRPQAVWFDSQKRLNWAERYTFRWARLDPDGQVRTVGFIQGGADLAIANDLEGTFGPKDDIIVANWNNNQSLGRYSADGVLVDVILNVPQQLLCGPADGGVRRPMYNWGVSIRHGRFVGTGNAGAYQCVEMTKRLPTDPVVEVGRAADGMYVGWQSSLLALTHGHDGQGELGYPNVDELGAMDDASLRAYLLQPQWGVNSTKIDNLIYWIKKSMTVENVYSATPPPDVKIQTPLTLSLGI